MVDIGSAVHRVGPELDDLMRSMERWVSYTAEGLRSVYEEEDPADEFEVACSENAYLYDELPLIEQLRTRQHAVEDGVQALISLSERLDFAVPAFGSEPVPTDERPSSEPPRCVFLVHGRDDGLRDRVARALEKLEFEVVILSEHPHEGRTLIEKFEDKSLEVGFAVVILSADDWARGPDDADWPAEPNRARQNVILELGYFMGRLGRRWVAAMNAPGIELPSDVHGVGYIPLDRDDWPFKLAAELAAAGFDVDLNRLS
jgi:predicted nucleotide-binding protein